MKTQLLNCLARLHKDETGQGLVEYCLIIALVAFAATAGMNSLASGLNSAFNAIGSLVTSTLHKRSRYRSTTISSQQTTSSRQRQRSFADAIAEALRH
jgi:pilus assembly protein Flp/PilA